MAPHGERQPDIPPRLNTGGRHSYGDLNQENNATEGGQPGIGYGGIGEGDRFGNQRVDRENCDDKRGEGDKRKVW